MTYKLNQYTGLPDRTDGSSPGGGYWTQAAGTLFPTTSTDRILLGGAVDDTVSTLQVVGNSTLAGNLTGTGNINYNTTIGAANTAYEFLGFPFDAAGNSIPGAWNIAFDTFNLDMGIAGAGDLTAYGFSIDTAALINITTAGDFVGWFADFSHIVGQVYNAGNFAGGTFFDMNVGTVTFMGAQLGIGVISPLAWIDVKEATTVQASIHITDSLGIDPSGPNSGDWWWNGTNLYFQAGATLVDLLVGTGGSLPNPITDGTGGIGGIISVDWQNRGLYTSAALLAIDYENYYLKDVAGFNSVAWDVKVLTDNANTSSLYWDTRLLLDTGAGYSLDWGTRLLLDGSGANSLDWQGRILYSLTAPSLDWGDPNTHVSLWESSTTQAQLRFLAPIGPGVDPTSPLDGQMWWNKTNLYFRSSGVSIDLLAGGGSLPDPIQDGPGGTSGVDSVRWASGDRTLVDDNNIISIAWNNHTLEDLVGNNSMDYGVRVLIDTLGFQIAEWGNTAFNFQLSAASTSKAQLNLVTSAGVNVTAPNNGDWWWNGANLYFRAGATTVDLLAYNALPAAVKTFLGTPSSANLAAALTDETGTGANVFANSPALAGTPTAPTAAAGTNTTQLATTAFVIAASSVAANPIPLIAAYW